ncbi:AAA family ATPase [Lacticaseibacillus nasuensis]|uniref:AAA+ ATPase domain-containing protein n=1 Tax=Lacticaseibacillus nasuensis JCM 17158 TaxID=1291734 RepID=A0A0R1JYP7_9LACO|nr:AAA family ATPase [Lacticaseibacillus nasuensis]KRK72898.1 hypothetical protein FD02_GL001317 [Lacticaseibacillus nasuensis JCM 17158]
MLYYLIDVTLMTGQQFYQEDPDEAESNPFPKSDDTMSHAAKIERKLAEQAGQSWELAMTQLAPAQCRIALVSRDVVPVRKIITQFMTALGVNAERIDSREVTLMAMDTELGQVKLSYTWQLTESGRWTRFGVGSVARHITYGWRNPQYREHVFQPATQPEVMQEAAKMATGQLRAELARVYASKPVGQEQAVDYFTVAADATALTKLLEPLLQAKFAQGWLQSQRYVIVSDFEFNDYTQPDWATLFRAAVGGTIVIQLDHPIIAVSSGLQKFAAIMREYADRVLVIFNLPSASRATQQLIANLLPEQLFIAIAQPPMTPTEVLQYAAAEAKLQGLTVDAELTDTLKKLKYPVTIETVKQHVLRWQGQQIRRERHPEYAAVEAVTPTLPHQGGVAYAELNSLIGLNSVKRLVRSVIQNYQVQRLREQRQLSEEKPSLHMVFTGNPGTAKTTVARLIAQILKDNQILRVGDLIELGRSDLVSPFVGGTAPLVKRRFQQAAGSVLFIDEAYSLLDGGAGSFGAEAITTIVQEMENHRDDVVVIFAGYPQPMQAFLDQNPGLRSRIPFQIQFPDYTNDELMQIATLMLKQRRLRLGTGAKAKLAALVAATRRNDPANFGNGRTVRSLIETALLRQGERLMNLGHEPSDRELQTLRAADFVAPTAATTREKQIGFLLPS